MTEHWHATSALVGLPGMPGSRSIRLWGERKGWTSRQHGRIRKWLESSLPPETQRALQDRRASCGQQQPEASSTTESTEGASRRPRSRHCEPTTPPRRPTRAPSAAGEAVADARLDLLDALDDWLKTSTHKTLDAAYDAFAEIYEAGTIAVRAETRLLYPAIARRALINWLRLRRRGGWSGLIPAKRGRRGSQSTIDNDTDIRDTILATLTDRPHSSPKFIREFVAARFSAEPARIPSIRTVQRYIKAWRETPEGERLLSQLKDPDKHRSRRMPAPGDMSAEIERLNQLFEADSTSVDVLCTDGPMALIVVIEVYTRRTRVLVTPRDRAEAVIALFRRCLLDWGVPEIWRCDNGASYDNRWVRRVIADLEITPDPCNPYDPDGKPFVERVIKTISHGLFENLPGYKGHSIPEQQKLRARHKFATRRGMPDGELFSVSLSSAELQQRCDEWITYIYERAPHEGLGKRSPFEVAAAWRRPIKRIPDQRALDVLLYKPAGTQGGWASVGPKGIRVDNGAYLHEDLGPLTGNPEKVQVRQDPTDYGRILVLDAHSNFICWAVDPDRLGLDRAKIAARMKAKAKAIDTAARKWAREKKKEIKTETAQGEVIEAAKRRSAAVTMLPHRSTGYEADALDEAARALEQRDADETPALDAAVGDDAGPEPDDYFSVVRLLRTQGRL